MKDVPESEEEFVEMMANDILDWPDERAAATFLTLLGGEIRMRTHLGFEPTANDLIETMTSIVKAIALREHMRGERAYVEAIKE